MDHFAWREGRLFAEDVPIKRIAECVGTPCYVYATATLRRHYRVFSDAFGDLSPLVCYAVKANGNVAVIGTLARLGAGADVVSGGELKAALRAGVPAERIVFSGVGKTDGEMKAAIDAGVLQINVESEPELARLSALARDLGATVRVALRVNPDVDARTHAKISTGRREDKFGIEWTAAHAVYARAARLPGLRMVGIAVHIGSQLTELAPFRHAFLRVRDLVVMLRADGLAVETLDLGGGLGVPYGDEPMILPSPAAYAEVVRATVGDLGCRLVVEPGRLIVGNAGVLVTRVVYVKEGATRTFVIVDAAMNDLLRPAMYGARHAVVAVDAPADETAERVVDIVGPVCESGDTFVRDYPLPATIAADDLLAIRTAGAYGAAMASTYNARPLVPEVLVNGGDFAVVRKRLTVDELLALQDLPPWLRDTEDASAAPRPSKSA